MRLYPSLRGPQRRTLLVDGLVVLGLLFFAWLGFRVHDAVLELTSLSRGVTEAGTGVQETLRQAGDAVGGIPAVGAQLQQTLQGAGQQTGGTVAATGRESAEQITSLGNLLGWLTFLLPAILLLSRYGPDRLALVRRLTDGEKLLRASPLTPERRRAVAQRAAFHLPYGALLRHTRDPLGDLEAGRYDALVAAELEAAGLAPAPRDDRP